MSDATSDGTAIAVTAVIEAPEATEATAVLPTPLSAIEEMKSLPRWVLWRLEPRKDKQGNPLGGKLTKVPYQVNGHMADSTDSTTWGTYEAVQSRLDKQPDKYNGIGWVIAAPYFGVDLDHVRNPKTGDIVPTAQQWVESLNSYTEVSPSGDGLHVWGKGTLGSSGTNLKYVEMYDSGRYFTVTGDRLEGTPATIEDRCSVVQSLYSQRKAINQSLTEEIGFKTEVKPTPSPSLSLVTDSASDSKFHDLLHGNWQQHFGSASDAVFSLLCSLAIKTNSNHEEMDKQFRASGMYADHSPSGNWTDEDKWGRLGDQQIDNAIVFVESTKSTKPKSVEPTTKPNTWTPCRVSHKDLLNEAAVNAHLEERVEGLVVDKTVNIWIGDSGLGKTPLLLQMGLCVAFGVPFLGQAVQRGRVLIIDYENYTTLVTTLNDLAEHLKMPTPIDSEWLAIVRNPDVKNVVNAIDDFKPSLIIVDALRGFDPKADSNPENAVQTITVCQNVSQKYDCSWHYIHHVRKSDRNLDSEKRPDLFDTNIAAMMWLEEAAGTRALVNQTHSRIGIAKPKKSKADLGIRGFIKSRGEVGTWLLERAYNAEGLPVGYNRLVGSDLLDSSDRSLLNMLDVGKPYAFGEVQATLGFDAKHRREASSFLTRCEDAKVIIPTGKKKSKNRKYTRVDEMTIKEVL